jgi:hypothetical protein
LLDGGWRLGRPLWKVGGPGLRLLELFLGFEHPSLMGSRGLLKLLDAPARGFRLLRSPLCILGLLQLPSAPLGILCGAPVVVTLPVAGAPARSVRVGRRNDEVAYAARPVLSAHPF